jgi:DNA-binding winged helix-turn-helix (wHTH) protein
MHPPVAGALGRSVISCGEGRLDIGQRRLLDGQGRELPLRNKSFDLLRALLQRSGQVVTRAELLDHVWPETHVTDDNVTQCVVEIRRQLRHIPGMRVRTVSRHGYALEVSMAAARDPLAAARLSVPDDGAAMLAKAIMRELQVGLARTGTPRVGGDRDDLRAELVLRGFVQLAGTRVHMTAELVEPRSDVVRWAGCVDADLDEANPRAVQRHWRA